MKLLKKACRGRATMQWKQYRITFEQSLGSAYRSSMLALQQEAEGAESRLQEALRLEEQVAEAQALVVSRAQQEQMRAMAAAERRQRRAVQARQLREAQQCNEDREVKVEAAAMRHEAIQVSGN
jgi:hypothetical protein